MAEPTSGVVPDASVARRRPRIAPLDVGVALGLAVAALLLRLELPPDGFFLDDAWQAFAVVEGSPSDPFTTGQTQPAFALVLMAWTRVAGSSDAAVLAPVLLAGTLGPPALYATLRLLRHPRAVAGVLASALVVAPAHVAYSGRVKVYVVDLLVVLVLVLALPVAARRRWRPPLALAWVVGSVALASTSSFSLLVGAGAGIVVVLHARGDRLLRVGAVAVQAVASAWILETARSTHDAGALTGQWGRWDGFVDRSPRLPVDVLVHLERVVQTYPGGPSWVTWPLLALALAGLAVAAWRGPRPVVARFLAVSLGLAIAGSVAERVPLGADPARTGGRLSLWLVPTIAFGLAAAVVRARRWVARTRSARGAFDLALVTLAVLVLASAIGHRASYPPFGSRRVSERAAAAVEDGDLVVLTRASAHSFALYSGVEVEVEATPGEIIGIWPRFPDDRFVPLRSTDGLGQLAADAERVLVLSALIPAPFVAEQLEEVAVTLAILGFTPEHRELRHRSQLTTWVREGR